MRAVVRKAALGATVPFLTLAIVAGARAYSGEATPANASAPTTRPQSGYSTAYVILQQNADGSDPVDETNDVAVQRGKPGGTTSFGTTGNQCGNYWNGTAYATSANFTGTGNEAWYTLISTNDSRGNRDPLDGFTVGTLPNSGTKLTGWTIYKENINDGGFCAQNGTTYYKYTATY